MIAQLFAIVAPILVCSAIGYGWARIKAPFHSETLGSLVFLVGTPCLVFSTLTSIRLEAAVFGTMALTAASVLALAYLVSGSPERRPSTRTKVSVFFPMQLAYPVP